MSSISPLATKEFAKQIDALGCDYLDAPVSGGEVGAKAASLTIMVGGSEAAFAQVKPLFELMGKNITLVGGNGDGQTTKVANQIIVALTIEAVGEALLLRVEGRRRSGEGAAGADGRLRVVADPRSAWRADGEAHVQSRLSHRAAPEGPEPRAVDRARSSALRCRTPRPRRSSSTRARRTATAALDHSALVRALEKLANFEIGQTPVAR